MINATTLRQALKTIYGIKDRYLVPLDEGWYVPTFDTEDKVGTWIGYRILSKEPILRSYLSDNTRVKSMQVRFRISFVGPQAEDLADQTILWEDRKDVREAFEASQTQINYNKRVLFSFPVKNGGLNDNICWCVDFTASTFYELTTNYQQWGLKGVRLAGNIIIPSEEDKHGN